jgi:hypothetical protein
MIARTSIKWGVFLGAALVIGTQILTWAGLGLTNWFVLLTYFLVIVFMALNFKELKVQLDGVLTFPNVLISIVLIVLISRLIFQIYMFVYTNYVDPNWVNTVAEYWTEKMRADNLTPEQIDQQIDLFRKAYVPLNMFTSELIFLGLPQMFLGMVTALFFMFKKKKA